MLAVLAQLCSQNRRDLRVTLRPKAERTTSLIR